MRVLFLVAATLLLAPAAALAQEKDPARLAAIQASLQFTGCTYEKLNQLEDGVTGAEYVADAAMSACGDALDTYVSLQAKAAPDHDAAYWRTDILEHHKANLVYMILVGRKQARAKQK